MQMHGLIIDKNIQKDSVLTQVLSFSRLTSSFVSDMLMTILNRMELRRNMRIKTKPQETLQHPAYDAVCSATLNEVRVFVLWGLHDARLRLCCEQFVNHIINGRRGLAKMIYCDDISPDSLGTQILKVLKVESFKQFLDYMPLDTQTWLVFEPTEDFPMLERIVRQCRDSRKIRLLFTTHSADTAVRMMAAYDASIVEPFDCCHPLQSEVSDILPFRLTFTQIVQQAELVQLGVAKIQRFIATHT